MIGIGLSGIVVFHDSMEYSVVPSTILTPLFRIRSLKQLGMFVSSIQGELSGNGFATLSELCYLDLRQNEFNGSIPSQLFQLRYLQYLDLSGNSFHGILSRGVSYLQNLRLFSEQYNLLTGNIPHEIGNMTKLVQLLLRNNNFLGEIPSSI